MSLEQYQQQCLDKLIWAFEELQVSVEPKQIARISALIVQTMTGPWRYFHTPEHIFEVGGSEDPLEILAALFHDIVYVQVDRSVHFNLTYYISPFIHQVEEQLLIRASTELPDDPTFEMVAGIFGFVPSQHLSLLSGQNEFLSAIVAAKVLEPLLSPELIAQIVVCIEATIPFRAKPEAGLSSSECLYLRLQEVKIQFNLNLTQVELDEAIKRSVRLANRDVSGFSESPKVFLDNTWSLLPETNHRLKNPSSYTVQEYRVALEKTINFLDFLEPELIFDKFQGEPDDQAYQNMVDKAHYNLEVGRLYLRSKLFAIAILEALSLRFGKATPLATMTGEFPASEIVGNRLKDFLPEFSSNYLPQNTIEEEVLSLLENGRTKYYPYDISNSPLATFIIKFIGFEEMQKQWKQVQNFFSGEISGEEFLLNCNNNLIKIIIRGISRLFDNRKAQLSTLNTKCCQNSRAYSVIISN